MNDKEVLDLIRDQQRQNREVLQAVEKFTAVIDRIQTNISGIQDRLDALEDQQS